jgi:ElaB/YqjD/DUF883 family membrane-anchored ribosome-binding protein
LDGWSKWTARLVEESRLTQTLETQKVSRRTVGPRGTYPLSGHWLEGAPFGGQVKMNTVSNPPSAQSATANLAETARSTAESVRKTAEDVTKQGQKALSQAGEAATEMADSASKQVTTFASEITKMTRDNPLGALAGATMFGLLVGLLLRVRSNQNDEARGQG